MEEPRYFVSDSLRIPIERLERRRVTSPQGGAADSVDADIVCFLVVLPNGFGASSAFTSFKQALAVVLAVEKAVRDYREASAESGYGSEDDVVDATARQQVDVWYPEDEERASLAKEGFDRVELKPEDAIDQVEASSSPADSSELPPKSTPSAFKSGS